ncbi:MAG: hypothetical protein V4440_14565 [Pseudomonadota bacterium]
MAITLLKAYGGFPAGQIVELSSELETALIAQNIATTALVANVTVGAYTTNAYSGTAGIAAGASSVVITNALVTANSKVWAVVAQAAADGTLLRVERVVAAAGSFTIYGTANATATTIIDWSILPTVGFTPAQ